MPIYPYRGQEPKLGRRVFLAPSAYVTGDVALGDDVSFWFHTAARGDVHWIKIGAGTNVQDGSILHVSYDTHPLDIGAGVVIGHSAVVHGCTIEDGALIGIGARVLDGAVVERGAQVGAGAVVAPGTRVPAGHLVLGIPARVARPLRDDERRDIGDIRDRYIELKNEYIRQLGAGSAPGESGRS
ncbi:MAG: gamma carbonic anhydrase family protein [Thermoanaerobaculia bacterium]